MRGFYIALEGGEGCGKGTQQKMLSNRLQEAGYQVVNTREPGGTTVGSEIRSILLSPELEPPPTPKTEAMLYYADRSQHIDEVIEPALRQGQVVLSDRSFYSTWAYQLSARDVMEDFIMSLHRWIVRAKNMPDLVVMLDIDPEVGLARNVNIGKRDRFELEDISFHRKVNQAYRDFAADDPSRFLEVDANQPPHRIGQIVWQHVEPLLRRST